MEFQLAPFELFRIGGFVVNNAMTTALLVTGVFVLLAFRIKQSFGVVPTKLQVLLELVVDFLSQQMVAAFGSKRRAHMYMPIILSLMLFIAIANQITVLPVLGQLTLGKDVLFKTTTSHLSHIIVLTLITLGTAHAIAFINYPFKHLSNFFKFQVFKDVKKFSDLGMATIDFLLGFLDIIGEFAKFMSLTFRLFGNVFAGELLIGVIGGLIAYIVPVPFMVLSIFSGFVQATVFAMISIQFLSGTINSVFPAEVEDR